MNRFARLSTLVSLGLSALCSVVLFGAVAAAAPFPAATAGEWDGTGLVRAVDGTDQGTFTIHMIRSALTATKTRQDGEVTLPDGRKITFWQEMENHGGRGYSLVSNKGTGGGHCFSNAMCQFYEAVTGTSQAFATTVSLDGADKMRIVVTELDAGKAVRFIEQSLSKR